jgi:hypothetical protein
MKKILTCWLCVVLFTILALIVKGVIFVHNWFIPLWYDPGLYRAIHLAYENMIQNWQWFWSLPTWIKHEPLWGLMSALVAKLWVGIDYQLWWGFIALSVGVYLVSLRRKLSYGHFLVMLFLFSAVQYELFSYHYYKQLLGIGMMFLLFAFYTKSQWRRVAITVFFLVLLHRHTAVVALLIVSLDVLWGKKDYKKLLYVVLPAGLGVLLYGGLIERVVTQFVKPLLTTAWWSWQAWDFLSTWMFLGLVWPSVILLVVTVFLLPTKVRKKRISAGESRIDVIWLVVCLAWTVFWLLNYKRGLVFLDLFLLAPVAYIVHYLWSQKSRALQAMVVLFFVVYLGVFSQHVSQRMSPRISSADLNAITSLSSQIPPNDYLMITDRKFTPWVMWYTQRKRISPWLSDDNKWSQAQWDFFWQWGGEEKCGLLQETYKGQKVWLLQYRGQVDYVGDELECLGKVDQRGMFVLWRIN